jgi:hypothetical protein
MKKSIKLFLLLILLFFAADRLVYSGIRSLDNKVFTGQSGKVNQFLSLKDSVNLLVFGSSRALHHLDPKVLDTLSYNMGVDATRIGYSAALISSLNKKEQIILVHIDPSTIYNSEYNGDDILGLLNMAERNENISNFISEVFPEEIYLSKIFNCYVYNGKVLGLLKNYLLTSYNYKDYSGYDPITPSQEQKQIFKKLIDKTNFSEFKYNSISNLPNPLVDKFISKIKEKCQTNKSKLVFFTSPSLKKNEDNLRLKTKEYFKTKGILYYDYSEFIDITNLDNWKDFTHLSEKGANVFSKEMRLKLK